MRMTPALSIRAIHNGILVSAHTTTTKLVRLIQSSEGYQPCFRTDERYFCKGRCEFSDDCKCALIASWKR